MTVSIKWKRMKAIWISMRHRCQSIKSGSYHSYGGRGIRICERWDDDKKRGRNTVGFLNFYSDMENGWFDGASIDRIDNDGDYTPENCQWLFLKDNVGKRNRELVEEGKHNLLGPNLNQERIDRGTHNFLKKGMLTAFDKETQTFHRVSSKEYEEGKGERYFAQSTLVAREARRRLK